MKNLWKVTLWAIALLSMLLVLWGCGDDEPEETPDEGTHTCAGVTWETKKEATCTAEGSKKFVCSCGKTVKTEKIPLLSHTEEVIPGRASTCTQKGLTNGKKCSVCGETLVAQTTIPLASHTYDDAYDATCNVCGEKRTGVIHTYSNSCDIDCDVCGEKRAESELTHAWLHPCSTVCSFCDATREASHEYAYNCSVACIHCGGTRLVPANMHNFEFGCSSTCRTCGFVRTDNEHLYSNACDQICDYGCGYERTEQHVWEGLCNALTCSACGATKSIAHVDADADFICDVCDAICEHICYNNDSLDCDRICVVEGCGKAVGAHTCSAACDTTCNCAICVMPAPAAW